MYSGKQWQAEIKTIFDVVGESFDFWTNDFCACHVHVSPGPTKNSKYSLTDLRQIAKGSFFWEDALCDFLPVERRQNRYADPNHVHFATDAYHSVQYDGWGGVFAEIDDAAAGGKDDFLYYMTGGANFTRYFSTNFDPVTKYGTVELRRQAGAASALTVIHRVLLALTLHVCWLNGDYLRFDLRTDHPDGDELFTELSQCIKMLPETCLGSRFQNWLRFCQESYEDGDAFPEKGINKQERGLREGRDVPTARRNGGGPRRGGARAGSRQSQTTLPERPRVRAPAASSAGRGSPSAPRPLARQGTTRVAREESPTRRPLARRTPAAREPSRAPAAPAAPAVRVRHVPAPARGESPPRRPLARTRTTRASAEPPARRPLARRRAEVGYEDDEWYD